MAGLDRRGVVVGGVAGLTALKPAIAGTDRAAEVEVVIVGAGVAGLAAAHALRRRGRSFVLLEARDRIGGRAFTESASLGVPWDRGAAWLHISERNPLMPVARRMGFNTTPTPTEVFSLYRAGRVEPEAAVRPYREARARSDRAAGQALSGDDDAPLSAVGGATAAEAFARDIIALTMGEPAAAISLRDLASMADGTDRLVAGGLGGLVAAYGERVPVRLGAAVEHIAWDGPGVRVEGPFGAIRARAALVTVPTGVLAGGGVRFAPELPPVKQQALADLPLCRFTKIGVRLARPLALPTQHSIELGLWEGGRHHVFHHAPGSEAATILFAGALASDIDAAGEAAAGDFARSVVAGIAGAEAAAAVKATTLTRWGRDPYARGAYSFVQPGRHGARELYGEPVGDRLYFAGEASATDQAVTVGGAYLAGTAAAERIARRL